MVNVWDGECLGGERPTIAIDYTGPVEGIYAFIYCTKRRSGQVSWMPYVTQFESGSNVFWINPPIYNATDVINYSNIWVVSILNF